MIRLVFAMTVLTGLAAVAAPVPKDQWHTVRGRVVWPKGDEIPEAKLINVTNDKVACCAGVLRFDELLIAPKSRGVRNVVVWLRPDTKEWTDPFPKDRVHPDLAKAKPVNHVVRMEKCQFVPRVFAARAGDTWEFQNEDAVAHNANVDHDDLAFNVTLPPTKGHAAKEPLRANAKPLYYKCDIHPWMIGRGRVFDHPYFAVTDKDGTFAMPLVPKGDWRIMYWHENGYHKGADGRLGFPLKVGGTAEKLDLKDVELELPARR